MTETPAPHVLVLSTADWNRPVWTNKQHVTVQLAQHSLVTYVESLGLRRPGLNWQDARRIALRLNKLLAPQHASSLRAHQLVPSNVTVVTPNVIPLHRQTAPLRQINSGLLRKSAARWINTEKPHRVLWTFSPVTYGLEHHAIGTVYHCVDLLAHFPRIDAKAVAYGERRLADYGVPAIASSKAVAEHLHSVGFADVQLWENVADAELITRESTRLLRQPNCAVFAGNLTPAKVDIPLLEHLLDSSPNLTLHLAGPLAEGGGEAKQFQTLLAKARVEYHGVLDPIPMAHLLGQCTVGLVPYKENDYTRGVFPMKIYEYLAAGLPVVCKGVPSVTRSEDVHIPVSNMSYAQVVRDLSTTPLTETALKRRRATAKEHSWSTRGREAWAMVQHLLIPLAIEPATGH